MAQAAELDPPLELLVLELLVLELPVLDDDGVLEPVDSFGVLVLLDVLSEDVDELRESLR